MAYAPLPRFLLRAPLLPSRVLADRGQGLLQHPLGLAALTIASPHLVDAMARGSLPEASLDRYHRRAAFRPTPRGLLAGVAVGRLAERSHISTGAPLAVLRIAWSRLADLGRALLDKPEIRTHARLRRAPSVVVGAHTVIWLGPGVGSDLIEERRSDLDELIASALDATHAWTSWSSVRSAIAESRSDALGAGGDDDDCDELDDFLETMIDDGLLHVDLIPPLVGPEPGAWMHARLARIPDASAVADQLASVLDAARTGDVLATKAALKGLPARARQTDTGTGGAPLSDLDATLVFRPARPPTLARAAVRRAAALAPLLFRLQEALSPPVSERVAGRVLADALDATTNVFGAGALDLDGMLLGDYGADPTDLDSDSGSDEDDRPKIEDTLPEGLLGLLVDGVIAAARCRSPELALRSLDLEPHLPSVATPATCELFLTPCRSRPGKPPGHDWLIGLHAPAGASWGRFAFALGDAAGASLLEPLREAENHARPGERRLDVVFAPSTPLGDLCVHPPLRDAALAVTGWPDENQAAFTINDLELCADPAALESLALRTTAADPVSPSPLHRVRSTTAPPGIWRMLVGWNLCRQHAPWALHLGPLAHLAWTPRISIDGFVVAPGSWAVPLAVTNGQASVRAIRNWRTRARLPRFVQVGHEDELLPVDLTSPNAGADLAGHTRVFEIWPPLGDTPDQSGRRLEAVIGLVDHPDVDDRAQIDAALAATTAVGRVPTPRRRTPVMANERWQTFKLFGSTDRQDAVLVHALRPAVEQARDAGEIRGWFFLRYIDGPGRRPHLRLRVRDPDGGADFARRLDAHLMPAFQAGDLVAVERTPYFPEAARFGGPKAMSAVHLLFEADSDLACAIIADEADPEAEVDHEAISDPRVLSLVAVFDALGSALGLDATQRHKMAVRRRDAHAADLGPEHARAVAAEFRILGPHLRRLLSGHMPPSVVSALRVFGTRARSATAQLDEATRNHILPPLLHLSAVRLAGLNRATEIRAYTFWERTLTSLERHRPA